MINLEKIKEKITKKKLFEIILLLFFAGLLTWFEQEFFVILLAVLGVTYIALFSISYLFSAYIVFKPLFKVAAGISLLIVVVNSYCEIVPDHLQTLDFEVQNLSILAILLIVIKFGQDFWNKVKSVYLKIKNDEKKELHVKIATGLVLLLFTSYIIIQLFSVFYLIFNNLCIF